MLREDAIGYLGLGELETQKVEKKQPIQIRKIRSICQSRRQQHAAKIPRMPRAPAAEQCVAGRQFLQAAEVLSEHIRARFEQRLREIRTGHKS
jgi:hypothetical protein